MNYIQPRDRHQISFGSLDEQIEADNPVRFIEAIVEQLDLIQLSYHNNTLKTEGRPPFSANVFLKLYLYGYLHGIPACRQAGAAAAD